MDEKKSRENERYSFRVIKEWENSEKEFIDTNDLLYTSDFVFSDYTKKGDSGSLLIATNKNNEDEKYVVKHEFYDCACNEYMYSKLANRMGIKTVEVSLFVVDDKEDIFLSDFVCGIRYLEGASHISGKDILDKKDEIKNWHDYFRFLALEALFMDVDGIEVLKYEDYIYRIDMTASLNISDFYIGFLAYNFECQGINLSKFSAKTILEKANFDIKRIVGVWDGLKNSFVKMYGEDNLKYFMEPFYKFIEIDEDEIMEWTCILSYIYPDMLGEYYEAFLENLKEAALEFIHQNEGAELVVEG